MALGKHMIILSIFLLLGIEIFGQKSSESGHSRQKRCIVIQKQSGTHGDSSEDDDEERKPQVKDPRPDGDKYWHDSNSKAPFWDVETFPANPRRYQMKPARFKKRQAARLFRKRLDNIAQ